MQTFIDAARHLFLGVECAGCGAPGRSPCLACTDALDRGLPRAVRRDPIDVPLVAAHDYRPLLEKFVPSFKDDGDLGLSSVLGRQLAGAVRHLEPGDGVVLVPVPSLPSAVRQRGLDHMLTLTRAAGRQLGMQTIRLLRRRRSGVDQRQLGRGGRSANVRGSMVPVRSTRSCSLVVCDDIVTTGSSLAEAIRALRLAGHEVVGAAVIGDADRTRR